jgi:hypothetical protein
MHAFNLFIRIFELTYFSYYIYTCFYYIKDDLLIKKVSKILEKK